MKGFIRIAVSLLAFTFGTLAPAQNAGRFIPQSPLTETEKAAEKAKLKKLGSISDELADGMLENPSHYHAFRDADIFAAFPELRGRKRLWLCQNSIMSGATEIAFLVAREHNEATLDKLRCSGVADGISCEEPQRGQYHVLDGSDEYFTLDGLTFATAKSILETYRAKRVTGLPQWLNPAGLKINSIKALSADRYQMAFGDGLCSGCFAVFDVRVESKDGEPELVYDGEPNAGCF